eukprot:m.216036 g.216036  ORF g.216036 m.216036 type:complete len:923 (+) comp16981_c1_seq4:56-2824(+)
MAGSALPFPSLCFPFPFPFLHTGGGDSTSTMRRDGRSIALQSAIGFLFLSIIAATIISQVNSAGYSDGRESGPEAQKLRLQDGELPRHGLPPGKGLIDHYLDVDVVVAGGGSTGVSAALAAARSGAQTVLIHGRPVLGGNAGSEIKLAMVGACGPRASDANELKMECREGGIVEEYTLDNAVGNPNRIGELFSLELYNKFRMEPNVQLFLNTWLVAVEMNGTRITTAIAEDQMSQNRYIISAKQFIDATGDGRLGAEAGAQYLMGREGPSQYNESLAEGPDTETEGSSLAFVSVDMGIPQPYTPPPWAMKYNASDFKYRSVNFFQYGYWWNEVSWPYNTISDNEVIRDQLLANMFGIWDYIKNSGDIPESENWALQWFGNVPCKREGRRFVGMYVSTQNDIMQNPSASPPQAPELYYDRVAYAGWNFDLHNPKGMFDTSHPPYSSYRTPYMFSTPLRSLISKDARNLFLAGRLASFSHVVYGSQRVMKTCSTMGQAVGTAAAYAVSKGVDAADIPANRSMVWSIQQQLIRDDAYIIGVYNEDPRDYARRAAVFASSEVFPNATSAVNGSAVNIISGQTRAVVTPLSNSNQVGGVPEGQGIPGSNRWLSTTLPASLTLTLEVPAPIAQVQLIFDTGMHRKLTFSVSGSGVGIWGSQPETVRDYSVEGLNSATNQWQLLCNVTDNFQRRRVHNVPCQPVNVLPSWPPLRPGRQPPSPPTPSSSAAVRASTCDPSAPTQKWFANANAQLESLGNPGQCLAFLANQSALGGHGQAVTTLPCAQAPRWVFSLTQRNGTLIKLPQAMNCVDYQGTCQCAKIVSPYTAGMSLELWDCASTSEDGLWSYLVFDDDENAGMLTAKGLCLDAQRPVVNEAHSQRLMDAPILFSEIRVNVTATNGVDHARILEIRLYDADGKTPFPDGPSQNG